MATILVIDDEEVQREALAAHLRKQGFEVFCAENGRRGLELLGQHLVELIITDGRMPELDGMGVLREARRLNPAVEVVLVTAYGSVAGAVDALQDGASHYLEKPIDLDELDQIIARALEHHHLVAENQDLGKQLHQQVELKGILSEDPGMQQALSVVARAAPSRATVLIRGESGTGKELVARAVHAASPRRDGPFVAFNCAALNENLVESELFGHEKGAFTGAERQRLGRFEQAQGGTLFIDEVAEIQLEVQVKLLRVLQERQIERLGGNQAVEVDVRLVAATHRDLEEMVRQGQFREDLFYRLNVVGVQLPPLRQRRADIPVLASAFLAHFGRENGRQLAGFSREAMDALMRHAYPGNVRELQNIVERAVVMARDQTITTLDLPPELQRAEAPAPEVEAHTLSAQVEQLERQAIAAALDQAGGVQSRAAALLGLTERNLRYKLKKYGIKSRG
ncbi:MAG: sigma-54-dependent Fis family transcriptional regulator [Candidatus Latescibacteria bacterium]|nr:sigma-54-dependent Fis family transcriptional regulator [Candidatus Latescibacterota bacterium]